MGYKYRYVQKYHLFICIIHITLSAYTNDKLIDFFVSAKITICAPPGTRINILVNILSSLYVFKILGVILVYDI